MGYTHYYYRDPELDKEAFSRIVADMKKVAGVLARMGVPLCGGGGTGPAVISAKEILFNGDSNCGHPARPLGIPWPSKEARGFTETRQVPGPNFGGPAPLEKALRASFGDNFTASADAPSRKIEPAANEADAAVKASLATADRPDDVAEEGWFAGSMLTTRTCGGDCSHASFYLPRVYKMEEHDIIRGGKIFGCTKTAFKPYDLGVNAVLIIAKHHLDKAIVVRSDGEMDLWQDGIKLTQQILGYGEEFTLDPDEED